MTPLPLARPLCERPTFSLRRRFLESLPMLAKVRLVLALALTIYLVLALPSLPPAYAQRLNSTAELRVTTIEKRLDALEQEKLGERMVALQAQIEWQTKVLEGIFGTLFLALLQPALTSLLRRSKRRRSLHPEA